MIKVKITVKNLENVRRAFNNLGDKIENPDTKLMQRLGDTVIEDIDQRFATRGYGTWKPLAPSTIQRKGHDNILIDTGTMMTSSRITELKDGVVKVTVPYGGKKDSPAVPGYHQNGTDRIPQRKIVEVTEKLTRALNKTSNWVHEIVEAIDMVYNDLTNLHF
jgi:phage gpG-like protein